MRVDMRKREKEMVELFNYELNKVKSNISNVPEQVMHLTNEVWREAHGVREDVMKGLQADLHRQLEDVQEWSQSFDDGEDDEMAEAEEAEDMGDEEQEVEKEREKREAKEALAKDIQRLKEEVMRLQRLRDDRVI